MTASMAPLFDSHPLMRDSAPRPATRDALTIVHGLVLQIEARKAGKAAIHIETVNSKPQPSIADISRQLPLFIECERYLPNEFLRSALFNARNHKHSRRQMKRTEIAILGGGSITYTGEELRQYDESVFLHLIRLAKEHPVNAQYLEFKPYSFCKAVGLPINGDGYQRLRDSIERMQATSLSVYSKRLGEGISLSMIPYFRWQNKETGKAMVRYQVSIPYQLVRLFEGDHYTKMEWAQRQRLPVGLATWLYGYYGSHAVPYHHIISTLLLGAGIETAEVFKARQLMKAAHDALVKVGFLASYEIVGDLIKVKRR